MRRVILCNITLMLSFGAMPAISDPFQLYVGYADNLRASGFFPDPWIGAPDVVSNSGPQTFDAGAIRFSNTGAASVVLTDVMVTLNPGTAPVSLAPWGAGPLTVPAGQNAVFTQTVAFNFDTSDFGFLPNGAAIDATHPLGGCTNPGGLSTAQQALCISNAPVVSLVVNGTPLSFRDTGHILDTFGYDFVCCSSDGNESINWNLIGSEATRGGTGVPEPSSALLLGGGLLVFGLLTKSRLAG